jgi:pimeloyl-ACP methyl ester carboxylesterase
LVEVEGAGHNIVVENSTLVANAILQFAEREKILQK